MTLARVTTKYVPVGEGQVLCQQAGAGPALLVLPEPPLNPDREWLETDLVRHHTVLVPDLGDLPPHAWAAALAGVCDSLTLPEVALLVPPGAGPLAALLEETLGDLVRAGVRLPGVGLGSWLEHTDLSWQHDGSHWWKAWHVLRDADMFVGPGGARFEGVGHPDTSRLHRRTLDLMRAPIPVLAPTTTEADPAAGPGQAGSWPVLETPAPVPTSPGILAPRVVQALAGAVRPVRSALPLIQPASPDSARAAAALREVLEHGSGTRRTFLPTSAGQIHLRIEGSCTSPPLLFLHGSPGSAESFAPTLEALARDHLVIAPDCPGNGLSTPHPDPGADLPSLAEHLAQGLAQLPVAGVRPTFTYGIHTGAGLALELALRDPDLTGLVVANGLTRFTSDELVDLDSRYFPDLRPTRHGTHLVEAWQVLRDVNLFWPWYGSGVEHVRGTAPPPTAVLHRLVREFLRSGPTSTVSYRAAFHHDAVGAFARLGPEAVACATPTDPLRPTTRAACAATGQAFFDLASTKPEDVRELLVKIRETAR